MSTAVFEMSPPRPAFYNEGKSVKSNKSNPPSLKSFSMKGKISFLSGLLSKSNSRIHIPESPSAKPTTKISSELPEKEKVTTETVEEIMVPSPTREVQNTTSVARKNTTHRNNAPVSRRNTLAKRLSTTFRKPSRSPQPSSRVPIPAASSRQLREAALRERGLLPARDMSALEREQDAWMSPVSPAPASSSDDGISAADRIKQEWESRLQSETSATELPSPTSEVIDSITPELTKPLALDLGIVHEVATPLPSPSPSLRKSASHVHIALAKPPPTCDLPPTPVDPGIVPLPPSPCGETSSVCSLEISPRIIPLPPSPTTPIDANTHSSSAAPHSKSSLPSLPSGPYECSEDGALAPPKSRSRSRPRLTALVTGCSDSDESSSIATPSLDTSSQLTLESSFAHKTKPNLLVKTYTNEPTVPVIVESPVEEYGIVSMDNLPKVGLKDLVPDENTLSPSTRRGRAQTTTADPEVAKEKRKSLFGRRTADDSSDRPKLSKSNSLANFRRSVVGTLTRGGLSPSSSKTTFDASHLPPSPTIPASVASQSMVSSTSAPTVVSRESFSRGRTDSRTTGVGPRPVRQPLSPTVHTRGTILYETTHIEDDESRRMTEMAFFG